MTRIVKNVKRGERVFTVAFDLDEQKLAEYLLASAPSPDAKLKRCDGAIVLRHIIKIA